MKKAISLLLALAMCLSLCACGKSKAAQEAQDAIAAIGTVTLDSEEAILYAEKLYGILTDNEKESVENRLTLVDAREEYDRLVQEAIEEELAAAAAAEAAALQAKLDAATPAMDAFMTAANNLIWSFEFVSKYAGNVNGNGSRKFADSFLETLETAYNGIDLAPVKEVFPELYEQANVIINNTETVIGLLNEMGRTNSTSNVTTMKTLSIETVQLINALATDYQNALNELNNAS